MNKRAEESIDLTREGFEREVNRLLADREDVEAAATLVLRVLGPEVLGFLSRVLGSDADADDAFAATSARLWRSLPSFGWRCSLRTWLYVIARHEAERFRRGAIRRAEGRVSTSALAEVVLEVTTRSHPQVVSERERAVARLRAELPEDDRAILVLRVDRGLPWDDIALAFLEDPEGCSDEERRRESARVRKRFQVIKDRLAARARDEGLS